jgi:Protein of unknown function (DUF3638)
MNIQQQINQFLDSVSIKYIEALRAPKGVLGGDVELGIISNLFGVNILIHYRNEIFRILNRDALIQQPIHIKYNGIHYDVCDENGNMISEVPEDGDCLFNACIKSAELNNLTIDPAFDIAETLRQKVCDEHQLAIDKLREQAVIEMQASIKLHEIELENDVQTEQYIQDYIEHNNKIRERFNALIMDGSIDNDFLYYLPDCDLRKQALILRGSYLEETIRHDTLSTLDETIVDLKQMPQIADPTEQGKIQQYISDVELDLKELDRKTTAIKGDFFTDVLVKDIDQIGALTDFGEDLDPKLFSMINNDAWLINSSFQGGDLSITSLVFKNFIKDVIQQDLKINDNSIKNLYAVVDQIHTNSLLPKKVIKFGKELENDIEAKQSVANTEQAERQRLEEIKNLASNFAQKIQNSINLGESCFIPGGFHKHAILYEFRKNINGKINLIVYNTGSGLEYHEDQTTYKHNIFKQKRFPAYVYEFPCEQLSTNEFKEYLSILLKIDIASNWEKISNDADVETAAKKSYAKDLYQHALPLIAHLGGKRVDPKAIFTDALSFITGQRSGKCSEAIFHPVIRTVFQDETKYQRFMIAYRKKIITSFMVNEESSNHLADPVSNRQIKNAITNLASRVYKHQDCFSAREVDAIEQFVANIDNKLNLAVKAKQIISSIDLEDQVAFSDIPIVNTVTSLPEIKAVVVPKITVSNVDDVISSLKASTPSSHIELISCKTGDTSNVLINKLNLALEQVRFLSLNKSHPREIIAVIEKLLLSWPIEKQLSINYEEQTIILTNIKELIISYWQQNLLQFGLNLDQQYPILSAKQVVTIMSALTVIAQSVDPEISEYVQQLINAINVNKLILKNQHNPYLASREFDYDLRFKQLLQFFENLPTTATQTKQVYINFIERQPSLFRSILLGIYDEQKHAVCGTLKIEPRALTMLTETEKCLLILSVCRDQLNNVNNNDFQQKINRLDYLVKVENVFGQMSGSLANGIKQKNISLDLTAGALSFRAIKLMNNDYQWQFKSPAKDLDKGILNESSLIRSVQQCSDEQVNQLLALDINNSRTLLGCKSSYNHMLTDQRNAFQANHIQISGYTQDNAELTSERFYLHQMSHMRSAIDLQFFATINFFQDNLELLFEDKWQIICELNLFQPNVLSKILEQNPNAVNVLYGFLHQGLIINSKDDAINATGLFLLKMQMLVVNYALQYKKFYNASYEYEYSKLISLNDKLQNFLAKSQNEKLIGSLYNLRELVLGCVIPITEEQSQKNKLIEEYLQAKLQGSKENLSNQDPRQFFTQESTCVNLKNILLDRKDLVTKYCQNFLLSKDILSEEILDSGLETFYHYPSLFYRYTDQEQHQHTVVVNLETGQILKDGKEYLPLPPEIFNNEQFKDLFEHNVSFAFHAMTIGDKEPSIFEINNFNNANYFIKKTTAGYCFQKEFTTNVNTVKHLYRLMSYQELQGLYDIIPKTLLDETHRFWMRTDDPKELLIENKATNQIVCKLAGVNCEVVWYEQQQRFDMLCENFQKEKTEKLRTSYSIQEIPTLLTGPLLDKSALVLVKQNFIKSSLYEAGSGINYQLMPEEEKQQLIVNFNNAQVSKFGDQRYSFWVSVDEKYRQILVEDNLNHKFVGKLPINITIKLADSHTASLVGLVEDREYRIFTQPEVKGSFFCGLFAKFEDPMFIEVRELLDNSGDDQNPKYIINLPRYGLRFEVVALQPLIIYSKSEPQGKLLLNDSWNSLINIKNALFIEINGERTVILPRQYFIADDIQEPSKFEYTSLCLDSKNIHQNLVYHGGQKHIFTRYCEQSEFLKFKVDVSNNKLLAKDSADSLYLAYVYLANFDPWSALKVLVECEKSGGLKCTQKEMEHLMLLLSKLPAQKSATEDVEVEKIETPEFLAVQAYAIYLYANSKHKQIDIEYVEANTEYGKLFHEETKQFLQQELDTKIHLTLNKYQQIKNNIPVVLKLTVQQELECLRLISDKFLDLSKKQLLIAGLLEEQQSAIALNNWPTQENTVAAYQASLDTEITVAGSDYQDQDIHFFTINYNKKDDKQTQDKQLLSAWIAPKTIKTSGMYVIASSMPIKVATNRRRKKILIDGLYRKEEQDQKIPSEKMVAITDYDKFKNFYFGEEQITKSMAQIAVDLDEKDFFKSFITYFYIALAQEDSLVETKAKLKEFLSNKLKIIANGHPIFGQELMVILYQILDDKLTDSADQALQNCLLPVTVTEYSYNPSILTKIGYTFDFEEFYTYLMTTLGAQSNQQLPIRIKAEGIQTRTNQEIPFSRLLHIKQNKTAIPVQAVINPLAYHGEVDILEKYSLSKPINIFELQLGDFFAQYQQFELKQATINHQKQELLAVRTKVDKFEETAKQELSFELQIGAMQNSLIKQQLELANKFLCDPATRQNIATKIHEFIVKSNISKNELQQSILKILNEGSLFSEQNSLHKLGMQGKVLQPITEEMALNLYLLGDEQSFIDATGLSKSRVAEVYNLITEYLAITTHEQQLQNISTELTKIAHLPDNSRELPFALKNLADAMFAENLVDPNKHPSALAVFQHCRKILLRKEQIDYLLPNFRMQDGKYQDLMSQLIMGFGKTFLLPIIAKVKANGTNLSVIEVPDPLFETNLTDLHNTSMSFLHQKTHGFRFNRNTPCTVKNLMDLYEWLVGIKQNRDYVVTTGETVASVNLRYLETRKLISEFKDLTLLNNNETVVLEDLKKQAYWLEKIVKLFKFQADAIIDEVHAGLDVRKKLIYSIGTDGLDNKEIKGVLTLYKILLPLKVWPIESKPSVTFQDIIINPGIIPPDNENSWKKMMETAADFLIEQDTTIKSALRALDSELSAMKQLNLNYSKLLIIIKNYLLNKLSTKESKQLPEILNRLSEFDKNIKDVLALYKVELTRLLPSTLKKTNRKHYGLLEEKYLLDQPYAVPFIASNSPHILSKKYGKIRTTNFANPDETINYTIQAYVAQGLPENIVNNVLATLKEQAKLELIRDQKSCYAETSAGLIFKEFITPFLGDFRVDLDNFDKDPALLATLVNYLQINQEFIFYALEHNILSKIRVEANTLEHNSNQHAYLYRSVQGISGTTDNYRSIDKMTFDREKYLGTNGITIDHIVNKNPSINKLSGNRDNLVAELLQHSHDRAGANHAIIDAGGLFTGITNLEVAQNIAVQIVNQNQQVKYVLFFDEQNQLSAIDVGRRSDKPIFIGSSDKEIIKAKLNEHSKGNCTEDNWFTYYDQRRTVGTDISQASMATAAITFSYDTTLTKFLQAAMRMRGLPQDQQLDIFVEPHIIESCFNGKIPNVKQIINFLYNNDIAVLSEDHFRYTLQAMDNVLYQELLQILLQGSDEYNQSQQEQKDKIFNVVKENSTLFLRQMNNDLFTRYGAIERDNVKLEEVLLDKKTALINLRRSLLEKIQKIISLDLLVEQDAKLFETKIDQLIRSAKQNCNQEVSFRENINQDSEVETESETETQKELQVEAQLEVSKIQQTAIDKPYAYDDWILTAVEQIKDSPENISQLEEHVFSVNSMISNVNLDLVLLDSNLYISKNHAYIYEQQHDLLDQYRLPIQHILMLKQEDGTISAIIITPNEAQQLIEQKGTMFAESGGATTIWLESPSGIVSYGVRPENIAKDLKYRKIKEQIKFVNGDVKSLLMDEQYLWLPRNIEKNRKLLEKILTSRPDQVGGKFTVDLLSRAKKLRGQYEAVLMELVFTRSFQDDTVVEESKIKSVVIDLYNLTDLMRLKEIDLLKFACKLMVILQDYQLNKDQLKLLFDENISQQHLDLLLTTYETKQILARIKKNSYKEHHNDGSTIKKQFDKSLEKLQLIKNQPDSDNIFKILLIESVVENDSDLIKVIFEVYPNILNEIPYNSPEDIHPAIVGIEAKNYLLLEQLVIGHFNNKEATSVANDKWLIKLFRQAYDNKDFKLLSILINNSNNIDLGMDLEKKITLLLAENFKNDVLEKFCTAITEQHKHKDEILQLKQSVENLAQAIKEQIEYSLRYFSNIRFAMDKAIEYNYEQPNFTIKIGTQLTIACLRGDFEAYQQLLQHGAKIHKSDNKYSEFSYAIVGGNEEIIKDLMLKFPTIIQDLTIADLTSIFDKLTNYSTSPKFSNKLLNYIMDYIIKDSLLVVEAKQFAQKLSKMFNLALKEYNNYELAEKLIFFAKEKNIDLLCACPNLLVELVNDNNVKGVQLIVNHTPMAILKAGQLEIPRIPHSFTDPKFKVLPILQPITEIRDVQKQPVISQEIMDIIVAGVESLSLENKSNNVDVGLVSTIVCDSLCQGYVHSDQAKIIFAKKLLDQFVTPKFNANFLSRYLNKISSLDLKLIENLSKKINSLSGDDTNLLFTFLNKIYLDQNHKWSDLDNQTINQIISNLLSNCDEEEIKKALLIKKATGYAADGFNSTVTYLLQHIRQHPDNNTLVMGLLKKYCPGNVDFYGENLLLYAIRNNNQEVVDWLLSKDAGLMDVMQNEHGKEDKCSGWDILCKSRTKSNYDTQFKLYIDTFGEDSLVQLRKLLKIQVENLNPEQLLQYLEDAIDNSNIKMFDMLITYISKFEKQAKNIGLTIGKCIVNKLEQTNYHSIEYLKIFYQYFYNDTIGSYLDFTDCIKFVKGILSPKAATYPSVDFYENTFSLLGEMCDRYPNVITTLVEEKFSWFAEFIKLSAINKGCLENKIKIMNKFFTEGHLSTEQVFNAMNVTAPYGGNKFFELHEDLFSILVDYLVTGLSAETSTAIQENVLKIFKMLIDSKKTLKAVVWLDKFKLPLTEDERLALLEKIINDNSSPSIEQQNFSNLIKVLNLEGLLKNPDLQEKLCVLAVEKNSNQFLTHFLQNGYLRIPPDVFIKQIVAKENIELIMAAILEDGILNKKEQVLDLIFQKYQQQASAAKVPVATQPASGYHPMYRLTASTLTNKQQVNIISKVINHMLSKSVSGDAELVKKSLQLVSSLISKIDSTEFIVAKSIVETKEISTILNFDDKSNYASLFSGLFQSQKNKILAILKFPGWCVNICEYYTKEAQAGDEITSFEQLSSTTFYRVAQKVFNIKEEFEQFKEEFDQMVQLAKNSDQVEMSKSAKNNNGKLS